MAVANVKWFDSNVYMGNKLAKMPAGTTMDSLVAQMEKAGYSGPEGYFRHFLDWGHTEDVSPSAGFDAQQYYTFKAAKDYYGDDVSKVTADDVNKMMTAIHAAGMDAWTHYQKFGTSEMVNASNSFDTAAYLQAKSAAMGGALTAEGVALAIQNAGMNAYEHYMQFKGGAGEVAFDKTFVVDSSKQTSTDFTLTNGTDVATANQFVSGLVYNPGGTDRINALQDEDVLTGTGTNPTLTATLGNSNDNGATTVTPKLVGIETLNLAFTGSGATAVNQLDLQDATGVTNAINITRISDGVAGGVTIDNISSVPTNLSVSNSGQVTQSVNFAFKDSAVSGAADETTLTLSDVQKAAISVESRQPTAGVGIETINLVSSDSANSVGVFNAEDLETLNISGDQRLNLGTSTNIIRAGTNQVEAFQYVAGFGNVAGSFTTLDASALGAALTVNLGTEVTARTDGTSGGLVNFNFTGTANDDIVRLINGTDSNGDSINGGDGNDTLQVLANVATGTFTSLEVLDIRGQGVTPGPQAITADLARFTGLEEIMIRNEGNDGVTVAGANAPLTVNLNNANATQYAGIQLQHGVTTNNGVADLIVNATLATNTTADTAAVTWADQLDGEGRGINQDATFNFTLGAAQAENVTLNDTDSESNSVFLSQHSSGAVVAGRVDTTLTITGGAAGQYISTDSFGAAGNQAAAANAGYGHNTDSALAAGNSTTVLDAAVGFGGVVGADRDTDVESVLYGTAGNAGDNAARLIFQTIDASTYAGNVELRLGDVTRADGFSSQRITTAGGNDSFIFDAIGSTSAGFTSGDTIVAGAGTDTLVLDGNTAAIPGTPRINHQASEWDNLSGIDVLRFGNNAGVANSNGTVSGGGAYYARIDNDFITQTDNGSRLLIINNDGDLAQNTESDLELDLRGLAQNKWVTFVGADANGAAGGVISSNRVIVDDISANQNMILNGGDTNVITTAISGNNNVYEVRNTANVSINDLAQTSNFGLINFTNDQAVAQTLTLTLNNTVVSNLVDSSWTATQASPERLNIAANDGAGTAFSVLEIDARQVKDFHSLNVTGSAGGNDVVSLNSNVGGAVSTLALGGGAADRVNWTGGTAGDTVAINLAGGTSSFNNAAGTALTTHAVTGVEYVDLSALTYATSTIVGNTVADTIIGGVGNDVITGDAGADTLTGGAGANTFVYAAGATGITLATADTITDFVTAVDALKVGFAGATAATIADGSAFVVAAGDAGFAAFVAAADAVFAGGLGVGDDVYAAWNVAGTGNAYVAVDVDDSGSLDAGDYVIVLSGIDAAAKIALGDFIV